LTILISETPDYPAAILSMSLNLLPQCCIFGERDRFIAFF